MAPTTHPAHDRLIAGIQHSEHRLDRFAEGADELDGETGRTLRNRLAELQDRGRDLAARALRWDEVEIGLPTAVADLDAAIDTLEADAEAAAAIDQEPSTYQYAVDRQLRAWQSRVQHLRLQGTLGLMEVREDFASLTDRLDRARGGTLMELQNALGDSRGLVEHLRDDVEEVLVDVRHAVERAIAPLTKET